MSRDNREILGSRQILKLGTPREIANEPENPTIINQQEEYTDEQTPQDETEITVLEAPEQQEIEKDTNK